MAPDWLAGAYGGGGGGLVGGVGGFGDGAALYGVGRGPPLAGGMGGGWPARLEAPSIFALGGDAPDAFFAGFARAAGDGGDSGPAAPLFGGGWALHHAPYDSGASRFALGAPSDAHGTRSAAYWSSLDAHAAHAGGAAAQAAAAAAHLRAAAAAAAYDVHRARARAE